MAVNYPKWSEVWPEWNVKRLLLADKYKAELFPSQLEASRVLVGKRTAARVVQVLGGERAGKSQWAGYEVAALLPWCNLVYLVGMEYENTEPEFGYIKDCLDRIGYLESKREPKTGASSLKMSESGAEVKCISLATRGSDALIATGRAPDIVVMCEAGTCEEDHFLAAVGRVTEKRGAVIMTGTLKRSKPWYVNLWRSMQTPGNKWNGASFSFPSWENAVIYPGGEDDPAIVALRGMLGPARFAERIGAKPVPSPLLVFGQEFDWDMHVKDVVHDAGLPLYLACDPGYAGAYSLLVLQATSSTDVRVIDEYYQQYATWDKAVDWLRGRPYIEVDDEGKIVTPIVRAVMDIAGNQHHADKSQVENWYDATGIVWRSNPVGIETGISRLRDFLRSPFGWDETRIRISAKCEGLLWELNEGEMYQADGSGSPVKDRPIDRNNHSRKALSYFLVEMFGESDGMDTRGGVKPGHNPWAQPTVTAGKQLVSYSEDGKRVFRFDEIRSTIRGTKVRLKMR